MASVRGGPGGSSCPGVRNEELRIPRTTRLQAVSHGRWHLSHLPDGPEQRERDAAFTRQDPLVANGWIYGYDPDVAA